MARPSATTLLSTQIDDFTGVDILTAKGLWAVLYKDQPINVKLRYWNAQGEFKKYNRATYPSLSPAIKLRDKLNKLYFTTEFTVKKVL